MGNELLLQRVLTTFVAAYETDLDNLKANKSSDIDAIRRAAHKMKGSAGNASATLLHQLAAELESCAETGDPASISNLIEDMATEFDSFMRASQMVEAQS